MSAGPDAGALTAPSVRVARVLPDVAGITKQFDYAVPPAMAGLVRVGTLVRVPLGPRRVGGWVTAVEDVPTGDSRLDGLRPIAKVTGWGPPADVVALVPWAAWRWAGKRRALLTTASPPGAVAGLPAPAVRPAVVPLGLDPGLGDPFARPVSVVRLPPAADHLPVVMAAAARGDALVITPSVAAARLLAARLKRSGLPVALVPRDWAAAAAGGSVVVGARAAAWAPVPDLAAVVVLDEHDEALQEERMPTWHARDVALERAGRAGVPCALVSPTPSLEALAAGPLLRPARDDERAGWPFVEVVDRTREDPAAARSLVSPALQRWLHGGARVVCVLNRPGRSRLLACGSCAALARCERCSAAVEERDDGRLACRRCGTERPLVCLSCGASRMKRLRPGTARLREELAAAAGTEVAEVTAATLAAGAPLPTARVLVGTEALLHRAERADVVAFLELDHELLAPRFRAAEQALALVARGARIAGGRAGGGRLLLQTALPRHEVVQAALLADPGIVVRAEQERRRALLLPPVTAMARVGGPGAAAFVAAVQGVEVLGPDGDRYLLRAVDHGALCDALAATPRPAERLRVEVDPLRV